MTTRYPTREYGIPFLVHAMQLVVNFDDDGASTGIPFPNYLPQDAQIFALLANVTTAFDASSPILVVGTNSSSFNNIAASGDINEAATGCGVIFTGADVDTSSAPLLPYAKYTDSGSGAAGRAVLTLLYIPKIDR